ncbi:MAG TPA: efflux RND transporter periplasmic adaptor subunit [Devosia sp.]|jgi:multidrug efflux system membrane fusion protein|nr:efflux RND transporter periplasmic adaptor subunit [Devosia sp.]
MRALFSYGVALLILLGIGGWLATGTLVVGGNGPGEGERPIISVIEGEEHGPIATRLAEAGLLAEHPHPETDPSLTIAQRVELQSGAAAPLPTVQTVNYVAQPMKIDVPLRGRTQARATVSAVAETAGIIDAVHVSRGDAVEVGDLLCTLDQGTRAAAVAQARAGLEQANASLVQAQLDQETNAELREKGLAAPNTGRAVEVGLSSAVAAVSSAQAALDNAQAELDRTEIRAKVAGVVQDPLANAGALLGQGQPCATIVQLNPMVFLGQVPESRIGLAELGLKATITTVTGAKVEGVVTFISAVADNDTRSFPVEIEFPNENRAIRDGVSAEAIVSLGTAPGHLVPQSVLTLDDDGALGVRTVEDGVVAFHEITIVSDTREGVWVTGLPLSANVITIGQENVTAGQAVDATAAQAAVTSEESV